MAAGPCRIRSEDGFSLIELTVAIFLFVFLVFVMATYYPATSLTAHFGQHLTYATLFAQQQMEEIRTKTFSYVTPTNFTGFTTSSNDGVVFTRTVTITLCTATTTAPCPNPTSTSVSANVTLVTVTVSWQEPASSTPKAVTLTSAAQNYF